MERKNRYIKQQQKHQSRCCNSGPAGFIQILLYSATPYKIASGHFVSCLLQVGCEVGLASVWAQAWARV